MNEQRSPVALTALLVATLVVGTPTPVFAADPPMTYYVALSDSLTGEPGGSSCSAPNYVDLPAGDDQAAIAAAINDATDGDTIHLCAGTYDIGSTLTISGKILTFEGDSAGDTALDGGHDTRLLNSDSALTLSRLNFQYGYSETYGGAVVANSATVFSSRFIGNEADNDQGGGAILSWGELSVDDSAFVGNTAGTGGAIYSNGLVDVNDSIFTGNTATSGSGGAIRAGTAEVTQSLFTENSASDKGGAIRASENVSVNYSTFRGNAADQTGGAILSDTAEILHGRFLQNQAAYGGAVHVYQTATVERSSFIKNVAVEYAGALLAPSAVVRFSEFTSNRASWNAGAVFLYEVDKGDLLQIRGNRFTLNVSSRAGALNLERICETPTLAEGRRVERANMFARNRATSLRRTANIELTMSCEE